MSVAMNNVPGMHSDKTKARALALAMHAAFVILLIFGVSWQRKPESPVVADLWSSLPPMTQPAQPKVEVTPEPAPPPKPAPRVEPPVPKAAPAPAPKPDIALKKIEKEKKAEPKIEPKAEPKKREDDKAARLKKEAEQKKQNEERELQLKQFLAEKEATAKAAAQASEQGKIISEYMERIRSKVRQNIVEPPGLQGNPTAEFDVVVIPGGEVLSVKLVRSSGVAAYDAAAERAIMKSAPLPLPPNPELIQRFRDLRLSVRPKQ
ncbi:MAG: TonB family protein [Burkholderiales bacterium]